MPELPSSDPKQFVQGAPVLHVSDVVATAAFYRDVLGFMWDFGDETYGVVWRDNSAIHFVKDDASPKGVHLFQWVKDVDAYYKEIVDRGADIAQAPTDQPYGIREFGYAMSMVWLSSLVRTSNTADSSLLLPPNKSLNASGGNMFRNLIRPAMIE